MVFSSTTFVFFFLPVVLLLYYLLPGKTLENIVLLIFSLIFYAWGEPVYVVLMVLSILINYFIGMFMDRIPEWKKFFLILALLVDLGLLAFFKYYGLFVDTVNSIAHTHFVSHSLALPIGISFYTFQTLSYVIDLYRGKIRVQKNPILFGVYISMFPQLIAGPIVRYEDIEKDLNERVITRAKLGRGFCIFVFGLAKKVLLANQLGKLFDLTGLNTGSTTVAAAWTGLIAYGLQIYFDFSGYSDMAIGLGKMLGFNFPDNFISPYAASSVSDFWRRWHITLGTWFREYVYIPLGGNRVKPWRHIMNIMIVWGLTGFWHGASWNFLLWGLYYGLLLLFEKYFLLKVKRIPAVVMHIWTLVMVFLGWGLFLSTSMSEVFYTFGNLFAVRSSGLCDRNSVYMLISYAGILLISILASLPVAKRIRDSLLKEHRVGLILIVSVLFIFSTAVLVTQNYNPFLYFRF